MTETTNFQLTKWDLTDKYNQEQVNSNLDKIDTAIGNIGKSLPGFQLQLNELINYVYGELSHTVTSLAANSKHIVLYGRTRITYSELSSMPDVTIYIGNSTYSVGKCNTRNDGDTYSIYNILLITNSMMDNAMGTTYTDPQIIATLSTPNIDPATRDLILTAIYTGPQGEISEGRATICRKGAEIPYGDYYINWALLGTMKNSQEE